MDKSIIAAFDFDGTLSSGESGLRFIRFLLGDMLFFSFCVLFSPFLLAYLFHFYDEKIMSKLVFYIFKGRKVIQTKNAAIKYSEQVMNRFIKPEVMEKILWHRTEGHRCFIVSRSFSLVLLPWTEDFGNIEVIATELEEENGIYTGRMKEKSCTCEEKVKRLESFLNMPRNAYYLYAYGDSSSDHALIDAADKGIWVK